MLLSAERRHEEDVIAPSESCGQGSAHVVSLREAHDIVRVRLEDEYPLSILHSGDLEGFEVVKGATDLYHSPQAIELRCRAHNAYQAELDYGKEAMKLAMRSQRKRPTRVSEPAPTPRWRAKAVGQDGAKGRVREKSSSSHGRVRRSTRKRAQSARRVRSPWPARWWLATRDGLRAERRLAPKAFGR